jgi:hypothetical protein
MGPQTQPIMPPYTGAALGAIVAFFVALDAVALYAAWRLGRRIGSIPTPRDRGRT